MAIEDTQAVSCHSAHKKTSIEIKHKKVLNWSSVKSLSVIFSIIFKICQLHIKCVNHNKAKKSVNINCANKIGQMQ